MLWLGLHPWCSPSQSCKRYHICRLPSESRLQNRTHLVYVPIQSIVEKGIDPYEFIMNSFTEPGPLPGLLRTKPISVRVNKYVRSLYPCFKIEEGVPPHKISQAMDDIEGLPKSRMSIANFPEHLSQPGRQYFVGRVETVNFHFFRNDIRLHPTKAITSRLARRGIRIQGENISASSPGIPIASQGGMFGLPRPMLRASLCSGMPNRTCSKILLSVSRLDAWAVLEFPCSGNVHATHCIAEQLHAFPQEPPRKQP